MTIEERIDAIISSTSAPPAFPPVDIDEWSLTDGSIYSTVSVGDLIERCRDEGVASDADIIVDIFLCYDHEYRVKEWELQDSQWSNAYDIYRRRR